MSVRFSAFIIGPPDWQFVWELAAAAPVRRRARTPDPALSHWHARPPAAVNAGHFSPDADGRPKTGCRRLPLASQPSRYPLGQAGNDPP